MYFHAFYKELPFAFFNQSLLSSIRCFLIHER
ncbi:Hypothetical protein Minf_0160 [Methylacidiphilum infernorum V4]|uniref:Uncharacterized protein n=1 Tax=Methylacidiphilum infernorum (isolate V4) TaxID=481448 RepID=B3DXI6_METI4|nr:Hypothetical protein Minf_0160 [Methylacidiphilum infernorum V4]